MKSTYQIVSEVTDVKEIYNNLYSTRISEGGETILEFVSEKSESFVKDIAAKMLKGYSMTSKQTWCVAYEFIKIKKLYSAWVEKQIEEMNAYELTLNQSL